MLKKRVKLKEIFKDSFVPILVFVGGVAFTAMSFCVYILVKPQITALLIAICVVDFLYTFFSSSMSLKYLTSTKRWIKGLLLTLGYIAIFIAIPTLCLTCSQQFEILKANIIIITYFAFFTGPIVMLVLPLFAVTFYEGA